MMRAVQAWAAGAAAAVILTGCSEALLQRNGPGPREVAVEHYQKAITYIDEQDIDMAMVAITKAIETDPTAAVYHQVHGSLLAQKGRHTEAEIEFRQAVARDPRHDPSWIGLIQVVRAQGRKDRAVLIIRDRLNVDPLDAAWHIELGKAYQDLGELKGAERAFRTAADYGKGERAAEAHARLGVVYEALGRPAAAVREYEESLKLNPNQPGIRDIVQRLKAAP